jgi:hypothetical protein
MLSKRIQKSSPNLPTGDYKLLWKIKTSEYLYGILSKDRRFWSFDEVLIKIN